MKCNRYRIIPIHERPDLLMDCCKLINSEWPSSDARRLRTLGMSCDNFPTCLVLLHNNKVTGHCKISLLPNLNDSCFIESIVIDINSRSQGLGSKLLSGIEQYVVKKGIKNLYLATKGQEKFYEKNGYGVCEPINIWDDRNTYTPIVPSSYSSVKISNFMGPPPPPMPENSPRIYSPIITSKTYMVKRL